MQLARQAGGLIAIGRWLSASDTTGKRNQKQTNMHPGGVSARQITLMPSTYLSLHFHLVFSTKDRIPCIETSWRVRLYEYLGGTLRGLGAFPEGINGVADHVHILAGLKATITLADLMRELKKASSSWIHNEIGAGRFAWQEGYAAFTVSATARDAVKKYIANQEEHHRTKSFREELIEMLHKAQVQYDPKSGLRSKVI
jgi:REP element-mobilizing transposase RayT